MEIISRFKWPIVLGVLGITLGTVSIFLMVKLFLQHGDHILAPGHATVTVSRPGDYVLMTENQAVFDGKLMTFPEDVPAGIEVKIKGLSSGENVNWRGDSSEKESFGSTRRISVASVTLPAAGQYEISIAGLNEQRAFYFQRDIMFKTFLIAFPLAGLGAFCIAGAIALALYLQFGGPRTNNAPIILGSREGIIGPPS